MTTLLVAGSAVFVGGEFDMVGGTARPHIAALDASTGALTAWNPGADGFVEDIAISGTSISSPVTSPRSEERHADIGQLDHTTGVPTAWSPPVGDFDGVNAIRVDGSKLYAGGFFESVSGDARQGFATFTP